MAKHAVHFRGITLSRMQTNIEAVEKMKGIQLVGSGYRDDVPVPEGAEALCDGAALVEVPSWEAAKQLYEAASQLLGFTAVNKVVDKVTEPGEVSDELIAAFFKYVGQPSAYPYWDIVVETMSHDDIREIALASGRNIKTVRGLVQAVSPINQLLREKRSEQRNA